ncbi:MAG TPA: hypothetical protein ACQGQU_04750, partial [Xylella fastidiosa subsp. multiplex]
MRLFLHIADRATAHIPLHITVLLDETRLLSTHQSAALQACHAIGAPIDSPKLSTRASNNTPT